MKVYSLILDKETVATGLGSFGKDSIISVSAEHEIVALWSNLIEGRLRNKRKAATDFDGIRAYYNNLSANQDFQAKVESTIERIDNYLDEATTFRIVLDSIMDYVTNQCSKLCAELVASMTGATLVEGPNVIACKDDKGRISIDWDKTVEQVKYRITAKPTVVSAGYGRNVEGYVVKIGRAGADLTATAIAAILNCESVVFCSKQSGIQGIASMTYEEAAHFCSTEVAPFFPAAMWPAVKYNIPIEVVNILDAAAAKTVISAKAEKATSTITGIVTDTDLDLITVYGSGLLGSIGISSDLFRVIAEKNINIRFISQSSSEYSISFAVKAADSEKAADAIHSLVEEKHLLSIDDLLILNKKVGIVSVCGDRMRNVPGISGKVFSALGDAGISIIAAAQGGEELSISIVVDENEVEKSVAALKPLAL